MHPQNQPFELPAYAFSAHDDFGFLAAAPIMHDDLTLDGGEEYRLRFRTVVFGRPTGEKEFEALSDTYAL